MCGVGGPTCPSDCTPDGSACGGGIIELKYDYQDRLVEWKDVTSGIRHTYRYDAFGRRIAKVVDVDGLASETRYFYGGATMWQVVEEQRSTSESFNQHAIYASYQPVDKLPDRVKHPAWRY